MKPTILAPNQIEHFYRGGDRIAALRGIEQTSEYQPEEWLGATVSRADHGDIGLSRTVDGDLLRDLVAADPAAWVGPDHADAASTSDTGILVKLLDARQRLPVHVHPSRAFATSHLDCPYGKTEAWFILDAEPGAAVHLGWSEPVDRDELDRRRDAQDSEWMLARMNRIEVSRGMGVVVPAGTVHAIDEGIFLAEVQEPTDFSIVLEWSITTSTRDESHLGLGFETVMPAVSVDALGADALQRLVSRHDLSARSGRATSVLAPAADPYFRVLHAAPPAGETVALGPGFAVALVLEGEGEFVGTDERLAYRAGHVVAVPAGFGPWEVRGTGSVLVATPGVGWPHSLAAGGVE
ncbi:class I mannose-6-phosphate isomerase [Herbiconiux sp. CPCC 205716]|uniref:Class I mannose-6-phosphate isomerase n=1 Tax=Herbiconiux gentiana TaxID=2970912 RepID=A0ABT2GDC0_9MICO|nr:class I mannose-6-phosphate isomerase [Herbiconiux gentiana]MCS5713627.1 class I mannose-6-phosphate isomerase [Herbiconiux gentiana]